MEAHKTDKIIKGLSIESDQLNNLLNDHPYFQLGLMEKSRRYREEKHIDSIKLARKCAILFPDRTLLYSYLNENEKTIVDSVVAEDNIEDQVKVESKKDTIAEAKIEIKQTTEHSGKTYSSLEKEYLKEVIDKSIQIEASHFSELDIKDSSNDDVVVVEDKISNRVLSFSEWIGGKKLEHSISFKSDLIDQFIQESPQISKLSSSTFYSSIEKGKESISEESLLYSETLAAIFVQQGNTELAIKAYRYLMLKNPQKSIYFADLIKKLEEKN